MWVSNNNEDICGYHLCIVRPLGLLGQAPITVLCPCPRAIVQYSVSYVQAFGFPPTSQCYTSHRFFPPKYLLTDLRPDHLPRSRFLILIDTQSHQYIHND
jgi:hypothetical protein